MAAPPGQRTDAQGEVGGQVVGAAAEDVAFLDQRGDHAGQRRPVDRHHPCQAGVHRQAEHRAPERGDRAVGVDGVEVGEQLAGLGERARRGSVDEPEVVAATPRCELEREPGEVGLGDLGRPVPGAGAVFELAPQPVGGAGLGASGAARSLLGRRPARRHRGEPRHSGAGVEARLAGEAAVDDHPDAVDGQRRLGDVGRQHDPSATGPRRCECSVLLGERQRAGEREHVDVGARRRRAASIRCGGSRRSRAGTPGRRRSAPAAPAGRRRRRRVRSEWRLRGPVGRAGPTACVLSGSAAGRSAGHPVHVDVEHPALALDDGGIEERGEALDVGCRRHRQESEVRADRRGDVERERQVRGRW